MVMIDIIVVKLQKIWETTLKFTENFLFPPRF